MQSCGREKTGKKRAIRLWYGKKVAFQGTRKKKKRKGKKRKREKEERKSKVRGSREDRGPETGAQIIAGRHS